MAAFAAIPVSDGESTPIVHTYTPKRIEGGTAFYENRASGIAEAFERLSVTVSDPVKSGNLYKVRIRLAVPKMEVVNSSTYSGITPAPTKAYECGADLVFFFPKRSIAQDRKNIRYLLAAILVNAGVIAAVDSLENVY